jgi:hypothetical protein
VVLSENDKVALIKQSLIETKRANAKRIVAVFVPELDEAKGWCLVCLGIYSYVL